jgi:hypothetical protein
MFEDSSEERLEVRVRARRRDRSVDCVVLSALALHHYTHEPTRSQLLVNMLYNSTSQLIVFHMPDVVRALCVVLYVCARACVCM